MATRFPKHIARFVIIITLLGLAHPAAAGTVAAAASPEINTPAAAQAAGRYLPDPTADRVLGQAAFNTNLEGATAAKLGLPAGIAITPPGAPGAGRLFVVEYGYNDGGVELGNHRVLSWPDVRAFSSGQAADLVIGQANFTNRGGGADANRFYGPEAAAVDTAGQLWVADTENNRVLRFDPPFSNGMDASLVLGQIDYLHNDPNRGGATAANTLYFPRGLALDAAGNLYVADDSNHRVLRFSPPFEDGMAANLVIGQADMQQHLANRGSATPGKNTLNHPKGIAVDAAGNLYVAEYDNNRVTRFSPPLSTGMDASGVYGQPDFSTRGENYPFMGENSLWAPVDVAVTAAGDALYVTDQKNVRVLAYQNPLQDAAADAVYGQLNYLTATPNDGGVSRTSINTEPLGLAVDAQGSLYLADFRNNRLLAYDVEVVGDSAPGGCTEAAFDAALAGGGTILFDCAAAQLDLSGAKTIAERTLIDGGGALTLDGQGANRLFVVNQYQSLTLRNITLTGGSSGGDGGAIYNNGDVILENSTLRDNFAAASGGAVVSYGLLIIRDSLLEDNVALNGGALYPRWGGAQTVILNSVLRNNRATDPTSNGWGGAILVWDGALVQIGSSDLYGNSARQGGAIYNFPGSHLTIGSNTRLRDNTASSAGGGVFNGGVLDISYSSLSGNSAVASGGGVYNMSSATLTNVTLSGNSAGQYGGGFFTSSPASLVHTTLSGNSAGSFGGGIFNDSTGLALSFVNSLVAGSPSGGNCGGAPLADAFSLSSDGTCALASAGSLNGVDPLLSGLSGYAGPAQVHRLQRGSPAIDLVVNGCPPPYYDQRGVARPVDGNQDGLARCDAGAVEYTQDDSANRIYFPLVSR